mmetsp:Transcript_11055/g.37629  ORF Transcript_11055/g.37629 Transcript_11055/m.37629 type:complete len:244 (-) Transcript_11055:438-1169(-)
MMSSKRCGVRTCSKVGARPSMSTTVPPSPILAAAADAKVITSPCVCSATSGMCLPMSAPLRVVLAMSDTLASMPSPDTRISHLPPCLSKESICMKLWSSSAVSTRATSYLPSSCGVMPRALQRSMARSVRHRNTLPLDQVTALGSAALTRSTVVPLPVPLRPWSTTTQPLCAASPRLSMRILATWSADLPRTSILLTGSNGGLASQTPLSTAILMPAASFSSSSASRLTIAAVSLRAKSMKGS